MKSLLDLVREDTGFWVPNRLSGPDNLAAQTGLTYNGVQMVPGRPDQWVFTDKITQGSFHTPVGISVDMLETEARRVRAKFAVRPTDAGNWALSAELKTACG